MKKQLAGGPLAQAQANSVRELCNNNSDLLRQVNHFVIHPTKRRTLRVQVKKLISAGVE